MPVEYLLLKDLKKFEDLFKDFEFDIKKLLFFDPNMFELTYVKFDSSRSICHKRMRSLASNDEDLLEPPIQKYFQTGEQYIHRKYTLPELYNVLCEFVELEPKFDEDYNGYHIMLNEQPHEIDKLYKIKLNFWNAISDFLTNILGIYIEYVSKYIGYGFIFRAKKKYPDNSFLQAKLENLKKDLI